MEPSDLIKFSQIMFVIAQNCRDRITAEDIKMRFSILKSYTMTEVEQAAGIILAEREFTKMPTIGEFIKAIRRNKPNTRARALVAANKIISHLNQWGATRRPNLSDDPIAERLMATHFPYMQWAANVRTADLPWFIKDFCETYAAINEVEEALQIDNRRLKLLTGNMLKPIDGGRSGAVKKDSPQRQT